MVIDFVENNKKLTDEELILLINNGEYQNFQIIINRYLHFIRKMVSKYCPKNEFEDAAQEAMFALYSAVRDYDSSKSTFSAFACLCISRSLIGYLRKKNTGKVIPEELITSIEDASLTSFKSPESILIEKEGYKELTDSIRLELSNMEYKVLCLFLEGKSYCEIGAKLHITEKSVGNALSRIRKKIKNNG